MESSLLTVLPNLSIGVISIGALVYVVLKFLDSLRMMRENHEASMLEREHQIRTVEAEVRSTVLNQLAQNTEAMNDTARVLDRIMSRMDNL